MKQLKRKLTKLASILLVSVMLLSMIPAKATATSLGATLRASQASATAGSTVVVKLDLEENPGIAALKVKVSFDDILTLTDVSFNKGMGGQYQMPQTFASPVSLTWYNGAANFTEENANFATLTFQVAEDAIAGEVSGISITHNPSDIYDITETDIALNVINGSVTVLDCIPGDINGDGATNLKDQSRLFQYLADWDVTVNTPALDTNGDGSVNLKDLSRLFQYLADWDVTLYPIVNKKCEHSMTSEEHKSATCTEDGNIAYWYCNKCDKYFSDAAGNRVVTQVDTVIPALGHTIVIDEAVPATPTSTGLTEGSHCSVCNTVIVAQKVTEKLEDNTYTISYDIANGDEYLADLLKNGEITNSNPDRYAKNAGLTLKNVSVPGYRFLGWYDLPSGDNAENVKKIEVGTTGEVELFAHWEKIAYTVQFKSSLPLETEAASYTVDKGLVLPNPKLSNYVFTGWAGEDGKLYDKTKIPVGSIGNKILTANWTSERNKAWTKTELDAPILHVDEENNTLLFVYEIGEVQNVPIYTIKDFGYISGDGVTRTATETYSATVSTTEMEAYTKAVASATTESSDWTLSEEWNKVTSVNQQWCEENGYTQEDVETVAKSDSNTWNISSGSSGSTDKTKVESREGKWEFNSKISESEKDTDYNKETKSQAFNVGAELTYTPKTASLGVGDVSASVGGGWGGGINAGYSNGKVTESGSEHTTENGWEVGGGLSGALLESDTTKTNTSWNSGSSFGGSSTSSTSRTTSSAISEKISEIYGYGESYTGGGSESKTQGLSATQSESDEYASSVTYSTVTAKETTSEWTTQATKPGYHRWVVAGTAHVFAVVGYDMSAKSYFTYTYSVMDDKTIEFEDYSYISAEYNDHQNSVISFEVPYEVNEYVAEITAWSEGLKVNQSTGVITGYSGTDDLVVIPEYMNVGNGDVVKITGISSDAFRGNTNIKAVSLSDFITEIPDYAFEGCSSLVGVKGSSVTEIGSYAFSGCTAIVDFGITPDVVSLGENAFADVNRLLVNAANADVAEAAIRSGAKKIVLYFGVLDDVRELNGMTLEIPEGTEYFEIYGGNKTFNGMTIVSDAGKTVLNKMALVGEGSIPLRISSPEVVLNQVSVSADGIALILSAEITSIGLQDIIDITSNAANTMLCKNIALYEINPTVDGKLEVSGKVLICGEIAGEAYLSHNGLEQIDADTFERMCHSSVVYFDANGGTVSPASMSVAYGQTYGDLPVPTKDYCAFTGWYTEKNGGSKVSENTIHATAADITLYAHWTQKETSDWVRAFEVPDNAQIVDRKYSYTLTSYTTSSKASMEGWTQYDTSSEWGKYGPWSSWGGIFVKETDSTDVETRTVYEYGYFVCPSCGAHWHGYGFTCYTWGGGCGKATIPEGSWTTIWGTTPQSEMNWEDWHGTGHQTTIYNGERVFRNIYGDNSKTQYRFRTREMVYTYYFYKTEDLESAEYPAGENVSNVVEWVTYRVK